MDEKKTYDVKGTVTISTEEYRDLLTDSLTAKKDADAKRSDWYKEYNRANDLDKKLKELQEKYAQLNAFVQSKKEYRYAFKLFAAGVEEDDDA